MRLETGLPTLKMVVPSVLLTLLLALLIPPFAEGQVSPELRITTSQDSVYLQWSAPVGQRRWAVLRSQDPYMQAADTLTITSDTNWVDPSGATFAGKHRFYRVVPWVPSPPMPGEPIEPFDLSTQPFSSYQNQDAYPDAQFVTRSDLPDEYCLRLSGDSWKVLEIESRPINRNTVWSIEAMCEQYGNYQMIGFGDGIDEMWYVLWGRNAPNTDSLITTFQGYFPRNVWQSFPLPVGEDWHGRFGTEPEIDRIYLVNDMYNFSSPGIWYLDNLEDATDAMPIPPNAAFTWRLLPRPEISSLDVHFTNLTLDTDSDSLEFLWAFGDGSFSREEHPNHRYPTGGAWPVTLRVTDGSLYWQYQTAVVSDYPVTITPQDFRIACVGDIILARSVANDYILPYGPDSVYDPVRELLTSPDITIGNLESPLTYANQGHPTKSIVFKGLPPYAAGLPGAGFDLVTLANNHILDYLEPGLLETIETVEQQGILWVGVGMNDILARRPAFLNREGQVIAVAGYCNRDGHYNNAQPFLDAGRNRAGFALWNRTGIEATVPEMRERADLVMLQVHCGSEYSLIPMDGDKQNIYYVDEVGPDDPGVLFEMIPDSGEVALRHYAIEQGADLVICHHPHIIQGLEVYQGKLIAHSLGNFIFDLSYNETLPSMILNIDVGQDGVIGADVVPIWIEGHLPRVTSGGLARSILDYLTHYSKLLNTHFVRYPGEEVGRVLFDTTYARTSETSERTLDLVSSWPDRVTRPFRIEGEGYLTSVGLEDVPQGLLVRYGREMLHWGNMEEEGALGWELNSDYETWSDLGVDGSRCLQIAIPGGTPSNYLIDLRRYVKINNSNEHSVLGWIQTVNATDANIQVYVNSIRNGGSFDVWETPTLSGSQTYTPVFVDMTAIPANRHFVNLRCNNGQPGAMTSTAWFDDVALIEWDVWHPIEIDGTVSVPYPNGYRYVQVKVPSGVDYPEDRVTIIDQREWPLTVAQ